MNKKYMVLFSPDFKYKADRGSVFYLSHALQQYTVHFASEMADKGAALNLARKTKQEKKRKHNEARVANLAKKMKNRRARKRDNIYTYC